MTLVGWNARAFDTKTNVFLVTSKTIVGQVTPLCDSLTTGLKPRH